MPDEYRNPEHDEEFEHDDDVPFHLPMAEDTAPSDEDTDELPPDMTVPSGVILDDYRANKLPTMPIPREPGQPDPKQTLPGSGGMDPNPDFGQPAPPEKTVANPIIRQQQPHSRQTVQAPIDHQRFQRPQTPPPPPQAPQGAIPPAPANAQRPKSQPKQAPRAKRRGCLGISPGCLMVFGGIVTTFCGGLTIISLVLLGIANARIGELTSAGLAAVDEYDAFESTFYYDRNGTLLYEDFNEGRRVQVPLDQMPPALINATVALEDDTFYNNPGIDVPATIRATLQFVGLMEGSSGGSTITQQLVRNIAFDFEYRAERSVRRKIEEILLALALNQRRSKDEILEMYLNEIYYGNLAYGAQAASQTFFAKDVSELTLGEAALLAGLPQAPASLDPLNPDPAVQDAVQFRWRTVLNAMVNEGYITDEERRAALTQGISFSTPDVPLRAPHFTVFAQQELESMLSELGYSPEQIAGGGMRVYTTVDLRYNDIAQRAVRDQIARLSANNVSNGAVVVTKPLTGEILAMVGSADYNNDAIDGRVNVSTALRQPGSTMKPFTYSAALESGFTAGDVIWDTTVRSITVPGQATWPVNYDRTYHGPVQMRAALANSYNVPAVKVLQRIGVPSLLEIMARFGVESLGTDASRYGLSLTLGGGEVSLLELTRAYSVFANQGVLVPTTALLCVVDSSGDILYQYESGCPEGTATSTTVARNGLGQQVLDPRIAFMMSDILADNGARSPAMGSNSPLRTDGITSSVKTGTTNDVKDNWTVGYTRNVAVGVWVGNSNGDPMVNSSGLTGAAPIWNTVITAIYNDNSLLTALAVDGGLQQDQLQPPRGLQLRQVCNVSRLTDGSTDCPSTISEWFLEGPAGIPDGSGNFSFQEQPRPANQPVNDQPFLQEYSPGVYRVLANPIAPNVGAAIQFSNTGGVAPPAPIYCMVPWGLAGQANNARELLFIAPPPDPADAAEAERYARSRNLAFLPTIACNQDLLNAAGGPTVITAVISQPTPGQVIREGIPVIGTVQFSPGQAQFYKLEIQGGQLGGWTTIGTTHTQSVVNGQLEFLPGFPGLQPGDYQVRLAVVGNDGNYVQEPYTVPFRVTQ